MEREINIGGKPYRLVANGATPRIYRSFFPKQDIFRGMSNAVSSNGEILDSEVFENLTYVMAIQGGSVPTAKKIDDWLAEMESPLAIIEAAPEVLELWAAETGTTSIGKKE